MKDATGRWRFALTLVVRRCEHCGQRYYAKDELRHVPGLCPHPVREDEGDAAAYWGRRVVLSMFGLGGASMSPDAAYRDAVRAARHAFLSAPGLRGDR